MTERKNKSQLHPRVRLRKQRELRGFSKVRAVIELNIFAEEYHVAHNITEPSEPTTVASLDNWERGKSKPRQYWNEMLCKFYNLSPSELDLVDSPISGIVSIEEVWQAPLDIAVLPLPPTASGLIGRTEEQQWLHDALLAGQIAGIWAYAGLGGIGKTAIVADLLPKIRSDFTGGICVIRANTLDNFNMLYQKLEEAFVSKGLNDEQQRVVTTIHLRKQLTKKFSNLADEKRRILIVIDNVEPRWIKNLKPILDLFRSTQVSVVMTSREELDFTLVDDTLEISLLSEDAAYDLLRILFLGRRNIPTEQEAEDIAAICQITGYHTQAMVLAAADFQQRKLESIETYRLYLANVPGAVLNIYANLDDESPQGLRLTFSSSLQYLSEQAQEIFIAMGAFSSPNFSREAIESMGKALGFSQKYINQSLTELLKSKLIRKTDNPKITSMRFELHPLVHQYAKELLKVRLDTEQDRYYMALAEHYMKWIEGHDGSLYLDDKNLVGILEWLHNQIPITDPAIVRFVELLVKYWSSEFTTDMLTIWVPIAIQCAERLGDEFLLRRANLISLLGKHYYYQGKPEDAIKCYLTAMQFYHDVVDKIGEADMLKTIGIFFSQTGEHDKAIEYLLNGLVLYRELKDLRGEYKTLWILGIVSMNDDPLSAKSYFESSININLSLGSSATEQDIIDRANVLGTLGKLIHDLGNDSEATENIDQAIKLFHKANARRDEAFMLQFLGVIYRDSGEFELAIEYYEESLDILNDLDDKRFTVHSLYGLGMVYIELSNPDKAFEFLEKSLEVCIQNRDRRCEGITRFAKGKFAEKFEGSDTAITHYRGSIDNLKEVNDLHYIAMSSERLGYLLIQEDIDKVEGSRQLRNAYNLFLSMKEFNYAERVKRSLVSLNIEADL